MVELKSQVKVETERKPGSEVVLSVEVPPEQVDQAIERALGRLGQRTRIAGFRPGKAPRPVLERQLGWPVIRQEALDALLPAALSAALENGAVQPVANPQVEILQFEREQPFRFKATVPVKPEVDLGDYASIRVARQKTDVSDAQVDAALDGLRDRFAELQVASDAAVQEHDVLTVDLQVLEKGMPVIGETRSDAQLEVSREQMPPGLADALLGARVGDMREAVVPMPQDHPKKELAGRPVTYRITVKDVKRKVTPPAEELPRLLGREGALAELREEVRKELEISTAQADADHFESEVLRQLSERARMEVPAAMVDQEIDRDVRDLESRLSRQGMKLERFLAYSNQTMELLRTERQPQAASRVRLELALEALAAKENLAPTDDEVGDAVRKALGNDPDVPARRANLADSEALRRYFRRQLTLQKAAQFIWNLAAP